MKSLRNKWVIFGAFCALLAGFAAFLLHVDSRSNEPAPGPAAAAQPKTTAENPDHELKALAVELKKKPGHTPVLMRMAEIERDQGKLDDAAAHLRAAVESEPENAEGLLELGRVLYEKGDVPGAIAQTARILESNPKHVDALYNLGAIYANTGNVTQARVYWTRAVDANPSADSAKRARDGLVKVGQASAAAHK
jgi:cytochrome c-type biogenesis protein CcmH/NrfG